jgi:hypothetical protein
MSGRLDLLLDIAQVYNHAGLDVSIHLSAVKKQKVAQAVASLRRVNSLGIASKSLPQNLELFVLSFLSSSELYDVPCLSKDMGKMASSYFSQVREWRFAVLPASLPRLVRSCQQLQSLRIEYAYDDREPLEAIAAMIRDNARTLRRFECHFCFPLCLVEALAGCPNLTAVDGLGHCRIPCFKGSIFGLPASISLTASD